MRERVGLSTMFLVSTLLYSSLLPLQALPGATLRGMVTLGPPGALLGVLVGHQYDIKSKDGQAEPASRAIDLDCLIFDARGCMVAGHTRC